MHGRSCLLGAIVAAVAAAVAPTKSGRVYSISQHNILSYFSPGFEHLLLQRAKHCPHTHTYTTHTHMHAHLVFVLIVVINVLLAPARRQMALLFQLKSTQ